MFPIWQKLNYLAGLTYPTYGDAVGGGKGMVAPFCQLTIGDMYKDSDGYISSLTYTVQDQTTWETEFTKLPKYLQVAVNYIYIGRRLPSSTSKHFEVDWVQDEYKGDDFFKGASFSISDEAFKLPPVQSSLKFGLGRDVNKKNLTAKGVKDILNNAGF